MGRWAGAVRLLIVISCWLFLASVLLNIFEKILIPTFLYSTISWGLFPKPCSRLWKHSSEHNWRAVFSCGVSLLVCLGEGAVVGVVRHSFPSGTLHSVSVKCVELSHKHAIELNQSHPIQVKDSKTSCLIFLMNGHCDNSWLCSCKGSRLSGPHITSLSQEHQPRDCTLIACSLAPSYFTRHLPLLKPSL